VEAKEEIRSRLNIEDVIGEYVQLKRAGRNFKGLSPFSQEKSPSFMVSPDKHIWHDFSSGRGGDVFTFVMEMEGVDFREAMQLLARKAGVDLSQFQKGDGSVAKKKERLFKAVELAAKFYQAVLVRSIGALDYVVKKRQFNKQSIQEFMIGYSPEHNELLAALRKRGFTEPELRDAGLVVTRRGGASDMFRGRMMVTLADPQGRPIGFTARILTNDPNAPKYINTPQTLLYDKSRHVFGLHLAKDAIRKSDFAVIVEGNLDVIASHQAGIKNVVATAGTALTEHHLRALSRFTQDVRLAFDADKAGINATERGIAIASNLGVNLGIVVIPPETGAKDADELIQKDAALWQQAIDHPKDAVEWLLDVYATRFDITSAAGKRKATDQALEVVKSIQDPVLLEHYVHKIADRIGASVQALSTKLGQTAKPAVAPAPNRKAVAPGSPNQFDYQDHLLALAFTYPNQRDTLHKLIPQDFAGDVRQAIAAHLIDGSPLLQSDEVSVKIGELELIAQAKYPSQADELIFIATDIAKRINRENKQMQRAALAKKLFTLDDGPERATLNEHIKQLDKDIEALKR
jgi:DNA primase